MGGQYEGYFEKIISAKYETREKEKEMQKKMAEINKRLNSPLIKKKKKKKHRKVSVQGGIKSLMELV